MEVTQPCPTHFSKATLTGTTIDRYFHATPSHIVPHNSWATFITDDPMQLDTKNISDHAPLVLQVGLRSPKPPSARPIDPYIFKHPKYQEYLKLENENLPLEGHSNTARLLIHKANMKKAALRTREWIQDHEEGGLFNTIRSLTSKIGRASCRERV